MRNIYRIIIAHFNTNTVRNEINLLAEGVRKNIDTPVVSETKTDDTFPTSQFVINSFATPFRFDQTDKRGEYTCIYKIIYSL